jgi:hypothetical protein
MGPIQELEEDKTMTTYEINYNNNMMKSFLVQKNANNASNTTLHSEGKDGAIEEAA